jgi:hypothetical protein
MIYDETTTKIEIPGQTSSNVVKVDFSDNHKQQRNVLATASEIKRTRSSLFPKFNLSTPWVLRLIGVLVILLLSMLVV